MAATLALHRAQPADERVAVLARHRDVGDDDVGLRLRDLLDRLADRRRGTNLRAVAGEQGGHDFPRVRIVLDDEHAHALEACELRLLRAPRLDLRLDDVDDRQADAERRSHALAIALRLDASRVRLDEPPRDREPEAEPA